MPGLYPDIYDYITTRLQDSLAGVDVAGGALDSEIARVLNRILAPYNVTYSSLSAGSDLDWVNEAAGLRTSARLLTAYSTGGANTDLTAEKTETMSRQFAPAVGGNDERTRWLQEAGYVLSQVSFIGVTLPDPGRFAVNGPKRHDCDGNWGTGWE